MSSDHPLISVCIPVYNGERYLDETIRSVLVQDYPRLEVIVQDNASTDGTWSHLQKMATEYPQLSIERNVTNVGMANNWNLAINRSQGDYVMLLSADDFLVPGFFHGCLSAFSSESVDAVTANFFWLKDGKRKLSKMKISAGIHVDFSKMILLKNPFSINFTLFKREAIERLRERGKLFAVKYFSCDYDLWIRFALAGMRLMYLVEPLGVYRVHDANLSCQTMRMHRQAVLVVLRHRKALQQKSGSAYRHVLLCFIQIVFSDFVRLKKFDRRQLRLLWGRFCRAQVFS